MRAAEAKWGFASPAKHGAEQRGNAVVSVPASAASTAQHAGARHALARALAVLQEHGNAATVDMEGEPRSTQAVGADAEVASGDAGEDGSSSDVKQSDPDVNLDLDRGFHCAYAFTGEEIGRGAYGRIRAVHPVGASDNARTLACKSLPKRRLEGENDEQWSRRLQNIRAEIHAMAVMRSSLSAARLEGAYEDDHEVHLVMERLHGSPVRFERGQRMYSENEVAHILRSVCRLLAQMHSRNLVHRDVKHSNFCFVRPDNPKSPLKAIDFGTAATFTPGHSRTDLTLQGTVHYESPEVLSGRVGPEADVWSVGVMAFQMLTGKFPFDDKRNPGSPSATAIWKEILSKPPEQLLRSKALSGVSDQAKEFIRAALVKEPEQRPSARQLLKMPFLQPDAGVPSSAANHAFSEQQNPLGGDIVKRMQRFANETSFRKEVLFLAVKSTFSGQVEVSDKLRSAIEQAEVNFSELCALGGWVSAEDGSAALDSSSFVNVVYALGLRLTSSEVQNLLDGVDLDSDKLLSVAEFSAATMDFASLAQEDETVKMLANSVFQQLAGEEASIITRERIEEVLRGGAESSADMMRTQAQREASSRQGISFNELMSALEKQQSLSMYDGRELGGSMRRLSGHGGSFTGKSSQGGSTCRASGSSSHHNALYYLDCA